MPTLFEKIHGAVAATECASAMATHSAGWPWTRVRDELGVIDGFVADSAARDGQRNGHAPSTVGAEGMERQRLCATAVIEKGGRIDAWDLAHVWQRDFQPENVGVRLGHDDQMVYLLLKAGMPPTETGRYATSQGRASTGAGLLPIGILNAGDARQAALDVYMVGRYRDVAHHPFNHGLECAAALQAGVAEALRPSATPASIIETVLAFLSDRPRKEVAWAMQMAERYPDPLALREVFAEKYQPTPIVNIPISHAADVLAEACGFLAACAWNPARICIAAANRGEDGPTVGIYANSLAGALAGVEALPADWLRSVDEATANDPDTVSRRSLRETAAGLYQALRNELDLARRQVNEIETQLTVSTPLHVS